MQKPWANREGFYRLTLRCLAVSFAVVGTSFLLAPDATIRSVNQVGALLGEFSPAPVSQLRFWLTLAAAYMLLVTILAWQAQRDLHRYRHLLPILAAGKASSSLIALSFYWLSSDSFIYLLNFLVDGSITLGVIAIWAGVPALGSEEPSERVFAPARGQGAPRLGTRTARTLEALLEALVPQGGAFPEGADVGSLSQEVAEFANASGMRRALRGLLALFELSPFFLPPVWWRRFSHLALEDRVRILEAWENSRFWPRRQAFHVLKLVALSHFYAHPSVQARLGYPPPLERVPTHDLVGLETAS